MRSFLFKLVAGVKPVWILIALAVWVLWWTPVIAPVRLFVVFLHELSHGLAAYLTGGKLISFSLVAQEGGLAQTVGGSRFVILNAGYLGSLFWGGAIILMASWTKWDKVLSLLIGLATVAITLFFADNRFGLVFGIAFGAALAAAGRYLPEWANDIVLRVIGFTCCSYAILDIIDDVIMRSGLKSDARMLAELTRVPTIMWGFGWVVISIVAMLIFLNLASLEEPQSEV